MEENVVKVGISDYKLAAAPLSLRTTGLGSCVGVIIYDKYKKVAGMAHVMLPDKSLSKSDELQLGKYANTAVEAVLRELTQHELRPSCFEAKIAGGAEMFQFARQSTMMRIGPRNVEIVKEELKKFRIPLVGEDTGGNKGRTIEFSTMTGMLKIRTVNLGEKMI